MIVDFKFDIGDAVEVAGIGVYGNVKQLIQTEDKTLARVRGECNGQIVNGTYSIDQLRAVKTTTAPQVFPNEPTLPRTQAKKDKPHGASRTGTHNARTGKGSAKQGGDGCLRGTADSRGNSSSCDDARLHDRDARVGNVSRSE